MNNELIKKVTKILKKELLKSISKDLEIFMFGSAARNSYSEFSDIDIIVLYPGNIDNSLEEKIHNLAYDIELEHDIVFGVIVYSREFWYSGAAKFMPLYKNIQDEGVRI